MKTRIRRKTRKTKRNRLTLKSQRKHKSKKIGGAALLPLALPDAGAFQIANTEYWLSRMCKILKYIKSRLSHYKQHPGYNTRSDDCKTMWEKLNKLYNILESDLRAFCSHPNGTPIEDVKLQHAVEWYRSTISGSYTLDLFHLIVKEFTQSHCDTFDLSKFINTKVLRPGGNNPEDSQLVTGAQLVDDITEMYTGVLSVPLTP